MSAHEVVEVVKLLGQGDRCSAEILKELGRTPAMRARMKDLGFIPLPSEDKRAASQYRPTRCREVLSKCGVELPKPPKPPPPRTVHIGNGPWNGKRVTLTRQALFERVWSEPVDKLGAEWGMSGRGLAKACEREAKKGARLVVHDKQGAVESEWGWRRPSRGKRGTYWHVYVSALLAVALLTVVGYAIPCHESSTSILIHFARC